MTLRNYRDLIETFEFGAQYSIFSGFRLVLGAMDENETLQQLIGDLRSSKIWRKALLNRLKALLRGGRTDSQMAFDGYIAAYVYCLWKADLELGYCASKEVLKTPDLWWAAKIALHVRNEYVADQISKSMRFQSLKGERLPFTSVGHETLQGKSAGQYSYPLSPMLASANELHGIEYGQMFNAPLDRDFGTLPTFSIRHEESVSTKPKLEFKMPVAS